MLGQLHKTGHFTVWQLHDVVFCYPIILTDETGTQIQAISPKEYLYTSTAHRHRLQIRKDFFPEIVGDKSPMHIFDFLLALIENNMVSSKFRQNTILKDSDTILQLLVYLIGDTDNQFAGFLLCHFIAITTSSYRLVFGHTYLIIFFQVG